MKKIRLPTAAPDKQHSNAEIRAARTTERTAKQAQPDCAKPQLLCSKADVLGGNGSVNDPVVLCKAERTVKVAADEDAGGGFP